VRSRLRTIIAPDSCGSSNEKMDRKIVTGVGMAFDLSEILDTKCMVGGDFEVSEISWIERLRS